MRRVAGHRLVDRVVDDLPDQVVQAARVGGADVHARPPADRLEALEDLDAFGRVRGCCAPRATRPRPLPADDSALARRPVSESVIRAPCESVIEPSQILVVEVVDRDMAAPPRRCSPSPSCPALRAGPARRRSTSADGCDSGRVAGLPARMRRTSSSVWRTESPRPMTAGMASVWASRSSSPAMARAWPSVRRSVAKCLLDFRCQFEQTEAVGDR